MKRGAGILRDPRSGQAVIEYLLGIALALGVVVGVMYPVLEARMNQMQDTLVARASVVMSQDQMGIPYSWFFGPGDSTFDRAGERIDQFGNGFNGGGGNGGNDGPGGGTRGGGGPDSGLGGGGGGGGGGGDPGGSGPNRIGGRTGPGGANRGGADEAGEDGETRDSRGQPKARAGGGGEVGGSSASVTKDPAGGTLNGEETAKAAEESDGITGVKKARTEDSADRRAHGGCGDLNIFTMLKIIAILLILFLLGAVALSGKGNQAKD